MRINVALSLKCCMLLALFCLNVGYCQQKEPLYLLFDKSRGDTCRALSVGIGFALKEHDKLGSSGHKLDNFIYKPSIHKKRVVGYSEVKGMLISGLQAIEKVENYLEQNGNNRFKTPYYYNSYFSVVYLYEKIDDDRGNLYEVTWQWHTD
jgi:hypothetical protein